jgi:hypothetical protein
MPNPELLLPHLVFAGLLYRVQAELAAVQFHLTG